MTRWKQTHPEASRYSTVPLFVASPRPHHIISLSLDSELLLTPTAIILSHVRHHLQTRYSQLTFVVIRVISPSSSIRCTRRPASYRTMSASTSSDDKTYHSFDYVVVGGGSGMYATQC
jgi:hypothetical protein